VTRYGHAVPCQEFRWSKPPSGARHGGIGGCPRHLDAASGLGADDLLLCLISGGGSALLALPAGAISLATSKRSIAPVAKRCADRRDEHGPKAPFAIKGGRLALAASPARVATLLISDVPGDDPGVIASGPTVPDRTTVDQALAVLRKYNIDAPRSVLDHLAGGTAETPKPGDPRFGELETILVATPQMALEAAANIARAAGYAPVILGNALEGEARDVGLVHAGIALQCATHGQPGLPPCVLLSGGETTVTVRGAGRGGRNAEFLLSLAIALEGREGIFALGADTGRSGWQRGQCRRDP
jgi:hydroxypyruvate reductase